LVKVFQVGQRRVAAAVTAAVLVVPAVAATAHAAGSRPGSPSGHHASSSSASTSHRSAANQQRAARLIAVRENAKRVAAELSTNPAGERSVPESHGFEPGTAQMIEQKLRALKDSNSAMMVIGTEMIVNNESKNLLTARTFVPFFDANGKIRYALEGDTDESFTAEELTSSALSQLRIRSLEPNLTEKEKAELDAQRAKHKLGYQHLYYKVTDLSDAADEPATREGAPSSPAPVNATGAGGTHAQRLLNSFHSRATRLATVFEYLSQRPGEYLNPASIGAGSGLGTDEKRAREAASKALHELFRRDLIHRQGDGGGFRFAGKTEEELSGISLTQGGASTVDDYQYQLGPHAQKLMNSLHVGATKQKEIFAFLSANPDTPFTLNELHVEVGGTSIRDTVNTAADTLRAKGAVKKLSASRGVPVRYQGKTEEELASIPTLASGN
jgi:hypothetical protein